MFILFISFVFQPRNGGRFQVVRMCRERIKWEKKRGGGADMMCGDALTVVVRFLLNIGPRVASKGAAGVEDGLENSSVVCRRHRASA